MKVLTQRWEILEQNVTKCDRVGLNPNILNLFALNVGHLLSQGNVCYLDERDFPVAHGYVLPNCEILKPFKR